MIRSENKYLKLFEQRVNEKLNKLALRKKKKVFVSFGVFNEFPLVS